MAGSNASIKLYTGLLGHGKTLKVLYDLIEEMEYDIHASVDDMRHYYSNIEGLRIEGVLDAPEDWRQVPNGSIIIYDEADLIKHYQANRSGDVPDLVREMKLARKRDIQIWFIVQSPSMLLAFIRRIVGEHIHVQRPLGTEMTKVWHYPLVQDDPTDELVKKKAERVYLFKFPKHLYEIYDSVNTGVKHRQKTRIPENWIKGIMFVLTLFSLCGYFGYQYYADNKTSVDEITADDIADFKLPDATPSQQLVQAQTQTQTQDLQQLEQQRVAMVFASDSSCIAKNSYGHVIDMRDDECRRYNDDPRLLGSSYLPVRTTYDNFGDASIQQQTSELKPMS